VTAEVFTLRGLNMVEVECCACAMHFYVPQLWSSERRESHDSFFCPNGHPLTYKAKSEAEKLRDELARRTSQLDQERAAREDLERSRRALQGHMTKLRKRVSNGVCPYCSRSFVNLRRHMGSKHADHAVADGG
jgi:hypothetical protein